MRRELWIHGPADGPTILFLDGEFYRDRVGVLDVLPDHRVALLSYESPAARHVDYICNEGYAAYVVDEVLPAIGGPPDVLAGLSLSGLAVLHLAMLRPDLFPRVLSQSPSAWWNDEWLATEVERRGVASRVWMSVGTRELEAGERHPPSGMLQGVAQLPSVERLADAWNAAGGEAWFRPYEGGHDPVCWRAELAEAVAALSSRDGWRGPARP